MKERDRGAPPPSDAEAGIWRGRSVARRFVSEDCYTILVGRTAQDNDILTFELGEPHDLWLHVASGSGSHVLIRNTFRLERLPRATVRLAAALAARYSAARAGGQVSVHVASRADVSKPRGFPPGKVLLRRFKTVRVAPFSDDAGAAQDA